MPDLLLVALGIGLMGGVGVRYIALVAAGVLVWFMVTKIADASSVIGYLNAVKREFALLAGAGVLAAVGGGRLFPIDRAIGALGNGFGIYLKGNRRTLSG